MSLILPQPRDRYDRQEEQETREILEREDSRNWKRDEDIILTDTQIIELVGSRIILRSPNGTYYALTVDDAGNLGTVSQPPGFDGGFSPGFG